MFRACQLSVFKLDGADHSGDDRLIGGFTTEQHAVLATTQARTKEELAAEFSKSKICSPGAKNEGAHAAAWPKV